MDTTTLELAESKVLEALHGGLPGGSRPRLTLSQLKTQTAMSPEELREVLAVLRNKGSVVRLHTVIDSYIVCATGPGPEAR